MDRLFSSLLRDSVCASSTSFSALWLYFFRFDILFAVNKISFIILLCQFLIIFSLVAAIGIIIKKKIFFLIHNIYKQQRTHT